MVSIRSGFHIGSAPSWSPAFLKTRTRTPIDETPASHPKALTAVVYSSPVDQAPPSVGGHGSLSASRSSGVGSRWAAQTQWPIGRKRVAVFLVHNLIGKSHGGLRFVPGHAAHPHQRVQSHRDPARHGDTPSPSRPDAATHENARRFPAKRPTYREIITFSLFENCGSRHFFRPENLILRSGSTVRQTRPSSGVHTANNRRSASPASISRNP